MQRLREKLFSSSKKSRPTSLIDSSQDEIYLEPEYDPMSSITVHLEAIAEELLTLAKKSSHTIRLSKLHDDLLAIKKQVTLKFSEMSDDLNATNKQLDLFKRENNKLAGETTDHESSFSARHNRSMTSDHSLADSVSCHSIWSPNSSILSSSVTTPIFRRRLAESSTSEMNYSSVIQEHFVSLYQQLCSTCSHCSCYQTFVRNEIELEYLSICSYNEQLKGENDLLQRLLADCKYSYEQQYVAFSQYEQYLIDYEQCIQVQHDLIRTFQQLIDRSQVNVEKRKRDDDQPENHIYQKIGDVTTKAAIHHEGDNVDLHRMISLLHDQCQRHVSQLPKRPQLFSFSQEQFHPPPNISGFVDVADLEIAILLVDLLTLKHENTELRWNNDRLLQESKVNKSKVDLYELTNKYFQSNVEMMSATDDNQELQQREKTLRLYVYRLYELLQTTSQQLGERQHHYENLLYQFKKRHRELTEQMRRVASQLKSTT